VKVFVISDVVKVQIIMLLIITTFRMNCLIFYFLLTQVVVRKDSWLVITWGFAHEHNFWPWFNHLQHCPTTINFVSDLKPIPSLVVDVIDKVDKLVWFWDFGISRFHEFEIQDFIFMFRNYRFVNLLNFIWAFDSIVSILNFSFANWNFWSLIYLVALKIELNCLCFDSIFYVFKII
jgi:hypothetical protein